MQKIVHQRIDCDQLHADFEPLLLSVRQRAGFGFGELRETDQREDLVEAGAQDLAAGPFDTVISDDGSFKPLTLADLFLTRPATQANVIVKADWTPDALGHTHCGIVARLDSTSNPLNYLLALVTLDKNGYQYATLHKVVNGVLTTLITNTYAAFVAGAYLEVRCDGNTISLWYNNVQVGANQTVNDAGILNNKIHGVFSTDGGNKLNRFFVGYA